MSLRLESGVNLVDRFRSDLLTFARLAAREGVQLIPFAADTPLYRCSGFRSSSSFSCSSNFAPTFRFARRSLRKGSR